MKFAVITLINSKYEPAFATPVLIQYYLGPTVGEPFIFYIDSERGNTSTVKTIMYDIERPLMRIVTRNSEYQIQNVYTVLDLV